MAGKVFFSVTMSLDGFIAPEERTDDPDARHWTAQWMELQQWIFPQRFFRENLKLGQGGDGTTFHFVNDGIETALDQARKAAGDRDVPIAGGGATILEYVDAGLIDEFSIALSPVLFGSGIPCSRAWTRAGWPWSRSAQSRRSG